MLDLPPTSPQCPAAAERYIPLEFTYGDPNTPGPVTADFLLGELSVLVDGYGDGGFEDGDFGTHLLINLVDCEGEIFEFINFDEQALTSEFWTRGLRMGTGSVRISPGSLIDVPDGDRNLTEIVAIEALIRDDKDPPTTRGKWYVDNLRVAEPVLTPGDLTGDGVVNLADFATFAGCFGATATSSPPSCSAEDAIASDFNGDGTVNLTDFSTFAGNFGQ